VDSNIYRPLSCLFPSERAPSLGCFGNGKGRVLLPWGGACWGRALPVPSPLEHQLIFHLRTECGGGEVSIHTVSLVPSGPRRIEQRAEKKEVLSSVTKLTSESSQPGMLWRLTSSLLRPSPPCSSVEYVVCRGPKNKSRALDVTLKSGVRFQQSTLIAFTDPEPRQRLGSNMRTNDTQGQGLDSLTAFPLSVV
jgi:hypothetical protein